VLKTDTNNNKKDKYIICPHW